jgi:hypothetical protein
MLHPSSGQYMNGKLCGKNEVKVRTCNKSSGPAKKIKEAAQLFLGRIGDGRVREKSVMMQLEEYE